MKTMVERRSGKRIPPFGRNDKADLGDDNPDLGCDKPDLCNDKLDLRNGRRDLLDRRSLWGRSCATAGAAVWAGIAVLARAGIVRVGAIELLFLFAPLVIVPLGMELGRVLGGAGRFEELARRLQPVGAGLAVVAMWLPPGRRAGLAALGWVVVCGLMAGSGFVDLVRTLWTDAGGGARATRIVMGIARLDLAVGGVWLVASRLGTRPMGIQEPIGLLTAVHFHFAGFATATIAAATLQFAERRGEYRWLKPVVLMVAGLPVVVAVGFVVSPVMKMVAAILFSASVAGLAIAVRACGRKAEDPTARILLQVAAGAVFAGMVLSGAYAVADYLGSDALTIPQMARTHGVLNAVGFCLTGMLGWLVETSSGQSSVVSGQM
jgi:YndJ-like protein